ncbi:MAG: hypothetical protein R3C16_13800 [Hyphomonadaceae bacterium]
MGWLFHPNYVGPDRRSDQFHVRFLERRREKAASTRTALKAALAQISANDLRWVDHRHYFGPDRRGDVFSFFFLERRKENVAAPPPPLHIALRQIRVRVLETDDEAGRRALHDRLVATAILADAHNQTEIGDLLMVLAHALDDVADDTRPMLEQELIRAEAMLG